MLSPKERSWVYDHAYLPEHLPEYVEAVSGSEAHLIGGYLCYAARAGLTFIGYPLGRVEMSPEQAFESALAGFRPAVASIAAPEIWPVEGACETGPRDHYYRLPLPLVSPPRDAAYMVRRAARELEARRGTLRRAHRKIIKAFLAERDLSEPLRVIFENIPEYVKRSRSVRVLEAWKGKSLAAFNIIDLGSAGYGFYLFNFRSSKVNVPGASDLLFHEMVRLAEDEGKSALNLGLGVHQGVRRFKEKWGGEPFLPHATATIRRDVPRDLVGPLMGKL